MYEDYKVYGPYTRKDGRKHVILYKNRSRTTLSYPRFLMECYLGRYIDENKETVHHKNGDIADDRIENLELVERSAHSRMHVVKAAVIKVVCPVCDKEFEVLERQYRANQVKQGRAGPFCSKRCAGKYGKAVQMNK